MEKEGGPMKKKEMVFKAGGVILLIMLLSGLPAAVAQQKEAAPESENITDSRGQAPITLSVAAAVLESLKNNKAFIVQTLQLRSPGPLKTRPNRCSIRS